LSRAPHYANVISINMTAAFVQTTPKSWSPAGIWLHYDHLLDVWRRVNTSSFWKPQFSKSRVPSHNTMSFFFFSKKNKKVEQYSSNEILRKLNEYDESGYINYDNESLCIKPSINGEKISRLKILFPKFITLELSQQWMTEM